MSDDLQPDERADLEDAINAYADAMRKRDEQALQEGRPEHDLNTLCAPLRPRR